MSRLDQREQRGVGLARLRVALHSERPFAILPTFRDKDPACRPRLLRAVRSAGFGFMWLTGAWFRQEGTTTQKYLSEETSILVMGGERSDGKLLRLAFQETKERNQRGFLFKGTDQEGCVMNASGETERFLEEPTAEGLADAYGHLHAGDRLGQIFVFESERVEGNWISKLIALHTRPNS